MPVTEYYAQITDMLQGQTPELQDIPYDRLDWAGPGAVLNLYKKTSGRERTEIINAMEQIIHERIEGSGGSSSVIAQVIHIASSLDIAQLEPSIKELRQREQSLEEPIRRAINNYLAFRQLRAH